MRPEIKYPASLSKALNYNEKKVQNGKAVLLKAANYLKNPDELTYKEKFNRINDLIILNNRADTKLIHLSLNFHPSEKERMTPEFLKKLSEEYMQKLGFGDQPYLVYQHFDAGHPHVHILSSLIKEDGTRINTHNQAKDFSEPIRKEMEEKYGLVKADKKQNAQQKEQALKVNAQKVQYGKSETLRSITNVLDHVLDKYKYTSLHEFNALLKGFNVRADRGAEDSRMYKNRGLYYRVLEDDGKDIGKPIKASVIHSKPTLDYLEKKFLENEEARQSGKKSLRTKIEWEIKQQPESLQGFQKSLEKEQVTLVIRRNEQGRVYGMTFIDHDKKNVFNGSDLGKEYSADNILKRLNLEHRKTVEKDKQQDQQQAKNTGKAQQNEKTNAVENAGSSTGRDKTTQAAAHSPSTYTNRDTNGQPDKTNEPKGNIDLGKAAANFIEQAMEPEENHGQGGNDLSEEQKRKKRNQSLER